MQNSSATNQQLKEPQFSFWKGSEFYFQEDGHIIYVKANSFGKETIFVDNEKVSEKRTFGRQSVHKFIIDQDKYEIEFDVISILKSKIHCVLIKNGVHVKTLKLYAMEHSNYKKILISSFIIGFFAGLFGFLIVKYWL